MSMLTNPNSKKYSFESGSQNLQADTFAVVSFKGYEALSQLYNFEIKLVTENTGIELGDVLSSSATFTIHREGDDVVIKGELAHFEEISKIGADYTLYRALLVPRLWLLTLARSNQVFLDQRVQEFVEAVLADSQVGLTTNDYRFDLTPNPTSTTPPTPPPIYPQFEYVSQYNESHFNFISRWLEREGIYYFFERTAIAPYDKAVFVDRKSVHIALAQGATLSYSTSAPEKKRILSFTCRRQRIPKKVILKDYNYETPGVDLKSEEYLDLPDPSDLTTAKGIGDVYLYGENYNTDTQGIRLAGIRREELLCRRELYLGESYVRFMQPGYTFTLEDHYRAGYNRKYLIVDVTHEGSQTGYLVTDITSGLSESEKDQPEYRNSFTAIPATVQFRAERRAEKPRIFGTMNAEIDAVQSGTYAELDDQGRYKVKLPFDLVSTRTAGQNSCYVRMMQPYSGINEGGFHFPLHKGAEVLLSFINGDPDRPVIAGAVPNPVTPSVIKDETQKTGKIITDGGNYIEFNDTADSEYVKIYSPYDESKIYCGYDPGKSKGGVYVYTEGDWFKTVGADGKITILGNSADIYVGAKESLFIGEKLGISIALVQTFKLSHELTCTFGGSHTYKYPEGYHFTFPKKKDITMDDVKAEVKGQKVTLKDYIDTTVGRKISTAKRRINTTIDKEIDSVKERVVLAGKTVGAHKKKIKSVDKSIEAAQIKWAKIMDDISQTEKEIKSVKTCLQEYKTCLEVAKTFMAEHKTRVEDVSTYVLKVGTLVGAGQLYSFS